MTLAALHAELVTQHESGRGPAARFLIMAERRIVISGLTEALLAGAWSAEGLTARALHVLGGGKGLRSIPALVKRICRHFPAPPRQPAVLIDFIALDRAFATAHLKAPFAIRRPLLVSPRMDPAPGPPATWDIPALPTPTDLAAWLNLDVIELAWFAGTNGRAGRTEPGPLAHYTYRWVDKSSGGYRLLEAPKARLKALQRRMLEGILDRVPVHAAAHGFCRGRGVLSYASPHAGKELVLALDLREFFASVRASRVFAIYRTMGYPDATARLLTGLSTHAVSSGVWAGAPQPRDGAEVDARFQARRFYQESHLPQGAPTSPALANLAAFRLDLRLAAVARAADATYTRYADDLAFSGAEPFARKARSFLGIVAQIVAEEGFDLNDRKTRFLGQGVRQRLAGVVVNALPNVARDEYDRLKATLHNCRRDGPAAHNRDGHTAFRAHLQGRVAWVEQVHPERGSKLREMFMGIQWPAA